MIGILYLSCTKSLDPRLKHGYLTGISCKTANQCMNHIKWTINPAASDFTRQLVRVRLTYLNGDCP